jgi:hypothetical protein
MPTRSGSKRGLIDVTAPEDGDLQENNDQNSEASDTGDVLHPAWAERWRDLPRYVLAQNVDEIIPVPADALGGLLVAVANLPVELMVSQGREEQLQTILGTVVQYMRVNEEAISSVEFSSYFVMITEAISTQLIAMERAIQGREASTSVVPELPWEPDERVNKAVLLLIAIGVPAEQLSRRVPSMQMGGGLPGNATLPSGVAPVAGMPLGVNTQPSSGLAELAREDAVRNLHVERRSNSHYPSGGQPRAVTKAVTPLMSMERANIDKFHTEMSHQVSANIHTPYSQVISPDLQTWIEFAIPEEGGFRREDWLEWPLEVLIRCLKRAATSSVARGSTGTEKVVKAIREIPYPFLRDKDGAHNNNSIMKVLSIIKEHLGRDFLSSEEDETAAVGPVLIQLGKLIKEAPGRLSQNISQALVNEHAELFKNWKTWWALFHSKYEEGTSLYEKWLNFSATAGWDANGEPLKKKSKEEKSYSGGTTKDHPKGSGKGSSSNDKVTTGADTPASKGECYICGRTNHQPKDCKLGQGSDKKQWHPDTNWQPNRRWINSPCGRRWQEKDKNVRVCPTNRTLSGSNYGTTGKSISTMSRPTTSTVYTGTPRCTVNILPLTNGLLPIRLEALLDTGSVSINEEGSITQDDCYCTEEVSRQLVKLGYVVIPSKVKVASCSNETMSSTGSVVVNMEIVNNHVLTKTDSFTVRLRVLPVLIHPVVLGFNTIKTTHALLQQLSISLGLKDGLANDASSKQMSGDVNTVDRVGSHDPTSEPEPLTNPESLQANCTRKLNRSSTRTLLYRAREKSKRFVNRRDSLLSINRLGLGTDSEGNIALDGFSVSQLKGSNAAALVRLKNILGKYKKVFSKALGKNPAYINPMHIVLRGDVIWGCRASQAPARLQSREKAAEILKQVEAMLQAGIIRLSRANAHSQVMLTPKKDNKWRFCIDYRRLNLATKPEGWPLPRIKDMIQRLGAKRCKYFGTLDATKGYYQAPLDEASKALTAFITPGGLYEWNRVAMGLRGAPAYFQKAMCTEVLNGLLYHICEIYLDDIIIFGKTEEEFHENLGTVLERLQEKNIFINPEKCMLGMTEIEYVGHTISAEGVEFSRDKLHKVVQVDRPKRAQELKAFLGLANYFREHVQGHSIIAQPLNEMLKNYQPKKVLVWTDHTTRAFEELKRAVNAAPKLFFVDEDLPVHLYTDASLIGIGAYLCQQRPDGTEVPIAFYSRSLREEERKWGIPCLEAFAIWQAFKNMDYLLRDAHTLVHTDHKNLVYIKESGSEKIIRWKLDLMEYDFELDAIAGSDNPIADYMSRNEAAEEHDFVIDNARKATHLLASFTCLPAVEVEEENDNRKRMAVRRLNVMHSHTPIPQEAYDEIAAVHGDVEGHHGVYNTLVKLSKQGKRWPYMREHVKRYIKECDSCQKRSLEQYDVRAPHYAIGKYAPMESVSVDLVGPFRTGPTGNSYALVCIDSFTRYMWCRAIPNKEATTVAAAYLDHLGHFGAPYEFKSDQGAEFVNAIINELVEQVGATKVTTFAYSHQSNGIVERSNKELTRWMEHMIYNKRMDKTQWEVALPFAVRIHNATAIETIKYSPAELLYGSSLMLDKNILVPKANALSSTTLSQWGKDRRALQDFMIHEAQEHQQKKQRKRADEPDLEYTTYRNGSYVLLAYPESSVWKRRQPSKLAMVLRGPYEVITHEGTTYTLRDLVTNQRVKKMVFHLRPYHYDPTRINPAEMALKDHVGEYEVESIISHTGKWTNKSSLRFVVKWVGYDEPEDDQRWGDLKHVEQLHDYMRRQGQGHHIPIMEESDEEDSNDKSHPREEQLDAPRRTRRRT